MKLILVSVSLFLALGLTGCGGDTRDKVASDGVSVMKEMAAALEGIKDEATALAAKPRLKALAQQMSSIKEREAKLPKPTEAEQKALIDKHGKEMEQIQTRMVTAGMRIGMDPKISKALEDIEQDMNKAMK